MAWQVRRFGWVVAAALAVGASASPIKAAGGKSDGNSAGEAEAADLDPSQRFTVRMPYLVAPVYQNGKLQHSIFITYRLKTARPGMGEQMLLQSRYLEDAFLRVVHDMHMEIPHQLAAPPLGDLKGDIVAAANRVLGQDIVVEMLIDDVERPYDPALYEGVDTKGATEAAEAKESADY
ncbi:MAG: hypothetical protein AAGF19_05795 [Pseudomonadota bacterium]